ncbi:MAG: hypothetical protein ACR2O2_00500 [Ruegeria sp.]
MRKPKLALALAACIGLAACGETPEEQALFGGSAGALGALAIDADPVVGAAAGAATNVLYCQAQKTCN